MFNWLFDPVKDSKPYWLELLPPVVTILVAIVGYWWGFKVWKKQKAEELRIAANQQRETAKVAACKAVWGLLAYLSEKENDKTVFVTRGDKQQTTWHLRRNQGQEYLKQVAEVFFSQGHGIFMPTDIRDDIYNFRSRVYRLLEKDTHENDENPNMIEVKNLEVIEQVKALRERLKVRLREEIAPKWF